MTHPLVVGTVHPASARYLHSLQNGSPEALVDRAKLATAAATAMSAPKLATAGMTCQPAATAACPSKKPAVETSRQLRTRAVGTLTALMLVRGRGLGIYQQPRLIEAEGMDLIAGVQFPADKDVAPSYPGHARLEATALP